MAAHADDLRHYYAETIGPTVVHAAGAVGTQLAAALEPGRYLLRTMDVSTAAKLWVRQGDQADDLAAAVATAAPNMPIDLEEDPRFAITFLVKAKPTGNNSAKASNSLAFITDAGTVNAVITRISS